MPNAAAQWPERAGLEFAADPYAAVDNADALLVVTEWREFRSPDFSRMRDAMKAPLIFDGRNLYDPELMAQEGFEYVSIGRPTRASKPPAQRSRVTLAAA
jgi:UDPglucose 6-dehydrogenase